MAIASARLMLLTVDEYNIVLMGGGGGDTSVGGDTGKSQRPSLEVIGSPLHTYCYLYALKVEFRKYL